MEIELMEYMKKFSLVDFIGFGRILKIEETPELEDYVLKIIVEFKNQKRKIRKGLLELAKNIAEENDEQKRLTAEQKNEEKEPE